MKLISLLLIVLFCSCGPSKEELEQRDSYRRDSMSKVEKKQQDSIAVSLMDVPVVVHHSKWRSSETGLPIGIVVQLQQAESNPKDNYVTVRKQDGYNEVVRDIDEDLWLSLRTGDIIE